jgi:hypothetical protein
MTFDTNIAGQQVEILRRERDEFARAGDTEWAAKIDARLKDLLRFFDMLAVPRSAKRPRKATE